MQSEKLYRLMLRVYPESHRREYGEPMIQMFRDRMKFDGRGIGCFMVWIQTILDLVSSAYREHKSEVATIADRLDRGSEYLDGLGSPSAVIALLATFLLMNSGVLLSSEGGVLAGLLVTNGSLTGAAFLVWFCGRPRTQGFLKRADRSLFIGAAALSLILLGGYVWIMLDNRLSEDPFTHHAPVALLPISLGIALSIGNIRSSFFNGLWRPLFICWGIVAAIPMGAALLLSSNSTSWLETSGGFLLVCFGLATVVTIYVGMAVVVWRGGVKTGGASLRFLAHRIRSLK